MVDADLSRAESAGDDAEGVMGEAFPGAANGRARGEPGLWSEVWLVGERGGATLAFWVFASEDGLVCARSRPGMGGVCGRANVEEDAGDPGRANDDGEDAVGVGEEVETPYPLLDCGREERCVVGVVGVGEGEDPAPPPPTPDMENFVGEEDMMINIATTNAPV